MSQTSSHTIRPLRRAGEMSNPELVEYAVISITMPNCYLPKKDQLADYGVPDETTRHLSVTPKGRLTMTNGCYIDSIELADMFAEKLKRLFSKRHYRYVYKMKVEIFTSPRTSFTTTKKRKDSAAIRQFLAKDAATLPV